MTAPFSRTAALSTVPARILRKKASGKGSQTVKPKGRPAEATMGSDWRLEAMKTGLFDAPAAQLKIQNARPPPTAEETARRHLIETSWKLHTKNLEEERFAALTIQRDRIRLACEVLEKESPALFQAATKRLEYERTEKSIHEDEDDVTHTLGPLFPPWFRVPTETPSVDGWSSVPKYQAALEDRLARQKTL